MKRSAHFKNNSNKNVILPLFDATIRWCLSFENNLSSIDVCDNTPCILRGMIEWHNLTQIINNKTDSSCEIHQRVAAMEERLVLLEDGIPCTLGLLEEGAVKAYLLLEFFYLILNKRFSVIRGGTTLTKCP